MDLHARTLDVLDWHVLVDALASKARTTLGARAVRALVPHASAAAVRADHDAIDELRALESDSGPLPIGGVSDIADGVKRASQGAVLDRPTLREAGSTLASLRLVASRLHDFADDAPTLAGFGAQIVVDAGFAADLDAAFDATGQLSAQTYPELASLRRSIADLHDTIRRTLEEMVKGDQFADVLQDRFVTQRGDRYVLPIKAQAKNFDLGIVHAESGSKRTVFVEPHEVVALNNRLKLAEAELDETEHRILTSLSRMLGRIAPDVLIALQAATEVDLACAREGLARALAAARPIVRDEGVIDLHAARHPVLHLRGVKVVPNDLGVDPSKPALVLTGPNTGGKTVALKTVGLCALLVRIGCFVPAAAESRVDWFPEILADVGDAQTVQGDLSSFSGHLVLLREMLKVAGNGCLFLLDELCSGTDPAQGGALAAAILDDLVARGPRVVVTTHYAQIKALAAVDARYALAAMEYAGGRPTWRVMHGATGESHALDTALRMGLPPALVEDARGRMGEAEQALHATLGALEAERDRAREALAVAEAKAAELTAREAEVSAREEAMRARAKELEAREAGRFLERLKNAEKAVSAVVADLQRAPDHRRVEAARATLTALAELVPAAPSAPAARVAVGDRVRLRSLGQVGDVLAVDGDVSVRVGTITVKARPEDVEKLDRSEAVVAPKVMARTAAPKRADLGSAVRLPANTLDLRGQRVEDAFELVSKFLADARAHDWDAVFLLHGHGTGALKDALRRALHRMDGVAKFAPAGADQGGDAYTVVGIL
jgi:DNA mismatch repair protein MutS2